MRILILYSLRGSLWNKYKRRLWRTSQYLVPMGADATLLPLDSILDTTTFDGYDFSIVYQEAQKDAPYSRIPKPILVPYIRRPPHARRGSPERGFEFFSGVRASVFGVYLSVLKEKL